MGASEQIAIGFDVGGTAIKSAVVRRNESKVEIIAQERYPTDLIGSIEGFIEYLVGQCIAYRAVENVQAVGIGFPSCVEWSTGIVSQPPNIPWWKEERYSLRDVLGARIGLPVSLDNDANCAATAELIVGMGRRISSFLFVTVGTGIGGALVCNGELYRGNHGCAGEVGHVIINMDAALEDPSYRTGVLERYVGRDAIIARARAALRRYPNSIMSQYGECLDVSAIGQAALKGDQAAVEVLQQTAAILGLGLVSAMAVTGIEHVILAGGIAGLPDIFYHELQATIRRRVLPVIREHAIVYRSSLGSQAGVIGAALTALGNQQ